MLKDRNIKKALDTELKNETSFEEFCAAQGIEYDGEKKKAGRRRLLVPVTAAAAAAVTLAIVLPITLSPSARVPESNAGVSSEELPTPGTELPLYGVGEGIRQSATIDEIAKSGIKFFNTEYYLREGSVNKCVSDDDDEVLLYYYISDFIFGDGTKDATFLYKVDHIIVSDRYEYPEVHAYDDCDNTYECGGATFEYAILTRSLSGPTALIKFKDGKFTQYITLNEFKSNVTAINDETVKLFLEKAYGDK